MAGILADGQEEIRHAGIDQLCDEALKVEGIDPGNCTVTFPELDKDAWEAA